MLSLFSFATPPGLLSLSVHLVKTAVFLNFFLPVGTFVYVAVVCFSYKLMLMSVSAYLQLL